MNADRYEIHINEFGDCRVLPPKNAPEMNSEQILFRAIRQQARDIESLRADLAAAVAERDGLRDSDAFSRRELARGNEIIDGLRIERDNLRARIAELEAALEVARRDAARLDTLSAHLADDITICPPEKHGKGDGWLIFWQTGWDDHGQLGEETHGATLREAIDAARAGNGGGS